MSNTAGYTPDSREFSFKDWFRSFNVGLQSEAQEKPYKQAICNVVGNFLMLLFSVATWGVLIILQPFLKPLLWALLCGSVLYPFKYRITKNLNIWLNAWSKPSIIHILSDIICFPVVLFNYLTDSLLNFTQNHFYPVTTFIVLTSLQILMPQFSVTILWELQFLIFSTFGYALKLCSNFTFMLSISVCFLWLLIFKWNEENIKYISLLSVITWFTVLCYLTTFLDTLKTPVLFGLLAFFILGFLYNITPSELSYKLNNCSSTENNLKTPDPVKNSNFSDVKYETIVQRRKFKSQLSFIQSKNRELDDEHIGDQYLYWVGCACVFVFFIKWWWTPYIVGLCILLLATKKLYKYIGIHKIIVDYRTYYFNLFLSKFNSKLISVIFPKPIIGIFNVLQLCKTKIIQILEESCDTISTLTVILLVIVFIVVAAIFLIMQMYKEGIWLVKVSSAVLNETLVLNKQFMQGVPDNWQNQIDSAFENAYKYGRDFISNMVRKLLHGINEDKLNELEKMILELWDRIYQAWLSNNDDNNIGPKVTSDAVYQMWDNLTLNIQKTPDLMNMNILMQFVNNNMTTLSSAVRHVWDFTIDNVGLVLYVLETLLSVVFISGSAVFSFIIDLIIFLTALFYLLSTSGNVYKPVEFITKINPSYGNKLAIAIERSVAEVFMVSFKLSLFYGLYTWFLHNLFCMHIVYVPTVIAAILAAIPVLPTYVVCIPGVLDLWLLNDNTVAAFCLFLLQFAPTNIVDAAIYEDIHGGHPYLTGLAMAGGVLCFGIEGAIIGPLMLCFMLVIINFCASLMQEQLVVAAPLNMKFTRNSCKIHKTNN